MQYTVASSLLFRKNFTISQILQIEMWMSQTMFTAFYFKDVTHRSLRHLSDSPVVAAHQDVQLSEYTSQSV